MTVKKIKVFRNKVIKNKKGNIVKFISTKNIFFKKFGEIYFNEIKHKNKKGWIKHLKNNCLIQCVSGKVKFLLIDNKNGEAQNTYCFNFFFNFFMSRNKETFS